jgi:hypothetical protein
MSDRERQMVLERLDQLWEQEPELVGQRDAELSGERASGAVVAWAQTLALKNS